MAWGTLKATKHCLGTLAVLKIIKRDPKAYLKIAFLNFLCLTSLYTLVYTVSYLVYTHKYYFLMLSIELRLIIGLIAFMSFLLMPTFVYSIFKLLILVRIKSYLENKKEKMQIWRFYAANLTTLIFLTIIFIIWGLFSSSVNAQWFAIYLIATGLPLCFFAYNFINILHSLFIKKEGKNLFRKALGFCFGEGRYYIEYAVFDAAILAAYFLVWYGLNTIITHIELSANAVIAYNSIFMPFLYILASCILAFNQLYFYIKTALAEGRT